jgi:hypothetical protein
MLTLIQQACKKIDSGNNNNSTSTNLGTGAAPEPANSSYTLPPAISGGGTRPSSYDLTDRMPPVDPIGQGHQNSCVAWALAYAAYSYYDHKANNTNYLNGSNINRSSVFSPAFLYNQINNGVDNGSSFWDAMNIMSSIGLCKWNTMPYDFSNFTMQPNNQQLAEAALYKITNERFHFSPINDLNISNIKDYIWINHPVIIRVLPDDNMKNPSSSDTIWSSVGQNRQTMGHAMVIVGYDDSKSAFKVLNSYGTGYKARGFLWITYSNLKNVCTDGFMIRPVSTTQQTKILSLSGILNFGSVNVGGNASLQFTISNVGNTPLTVSGINFPVGYNLSWTSGVIQPNVQKVVTVTFNPTASQSYNGTISISSDATGGPNTINVTGTGITQQQTRIISLSGNLSFGNVVVGQTAQRTLTITNNGNSTLNVSSISTTPGVFAANFSGSVLPGNSQNVNVTFSPLIVQTYNGNLTVNSNATSGVSSINVSGNGITNTPTVVPALGTYSNCIGSGTACSSPSYGLGVITSRVVSINTTTKQIVIEIKKCDGTAFNAGGNINVVSLLCGGGVSYGFGSFSAGSTTVQLSFTDNNMVGSKAYVPFIIQGASSNILYSAPTMVITY